MKFYIVYEEYEGRQYNHTYYQSKVKAVSVLQAEKKVAENGGFECTWFMREDTLIKDVTEKAMKDFLGNELAVGDEVVFSDNHHNFHTCVVDCFDIDDEQQDMAFVKPHNCWIYNNNLIKAILL